MAAHSGRDPVAEPALGEPVAEFCAGLRRLQQESGLDRAGLAHRVGYSRSQLYAILDGRVTRPPDWDRLVKPVVQICTGNDEHALGVWRHRHEVLVDVDYALRHRDRPDHRRPRPTQKVSPGTDRDLGAGPDQHAAPTDPAHASDPGVPGAVPAAPPLPRQLPAHTPYFVGRAEELRRLSTLLTSTAGASGGAVVIIAIGGTAGVGKTALALHWAHSVAERFPDGQLYTNLRGFDPTTAPLPPAEALRGFLDALGIPPNRSPASVDAQAGLYRSLLASRRMLVVLDNARDAEQVRPLLPASPGCLVVVTSRNQLASLITHHGACQVTLDVLSLPEARELLACHLGPDRIGADPDSATQLIEHCARLPLALGIVAARAAAYPGFDLRLLAKELADEHTRLDALDTGEPTTSARAVFSWSYQHLSTPAARMFRLLGLHPGPDIALPAATHLTDLPPHQAREALNELTRAHLLTLHPPGRYTFHDLLRTYATHQATLIDPEDQRRAALTRLFDHYLHTTATAMNTLYPADAQAPPNVPLPAMDRATAQSWLNSERTNLTALIAYTAAHGWHIHTARLASTLFHYLESGVHYRDALTLYTYARDAARSTNERATEALALSNLGLVHWQQGRYRQAAEHHQQALALFRELGDRKGEAHTLSRLGLIHWTQGRYTQALDHHHQAIAICRDISFPVGEAQALVQLSLVPWRQGHYQQAAEHQQQALAIARKVGFSGSEALALAHLGVLHWHQGRYQQANEFHQQALAITRRMGVLWGEAYALSNLGLVHWRQGHYHQATDLHQQALAIARTIRFPVGEAHALNNLGLLLCHQGHHTQATEHHQHALTISREIGLPIGEILALTGLGLSHCKQGRYQEAADHHQRALTISREIGDRTSEAPIRNGLGEAHHANVHLDQAWTQHTAALTLAAEIGDRYEQARAHDGLAHTHHATGDHDRARHHWHQAATIFADLDVPDADDVRAHLAALD